MEGARELLARTGERVFNDVEEEVRELIEEAQAEVNIAVADIEEAIELEGDKWKSAIDRFESQWLSGGRARRFDTLGSAGGSPGPGAEFWKSAFATDEIEAKIKQIRSEVREVQAEVDDDVAEIRQRWNTTSKGSSGCRPRLPKLRSRAAPVREYVADTIFDSEMVDGEKARSEAARGRGGAAGGGGGGRRRPAGPADGAE